MTPLGDAPPSTLRFCELAKPLMSKTTASRKQGTAASQAAWLEITSGKESQGDGTIAYRVAQNAEPLTRKSVTSRCPLARD